MCIRDSSKFFIPENSILIRCNPIIPKIKGSKKLIEFGKKDVIFILKKAFINTSSIEIDSKNKPEYKYVFKFCLLGLKKLILLIVYFSLIAIFLLYQFIKTEIAKLIDKYVNIVIDTISIALPVCIIAVPANTKTKSG